MGSNGLTSPPEPVYALDHVAPLDAHAFPNAPPKGSRSPPTTIVNVRFLLKEYGITVRYDVIKKRVRITMPGQSGATDNFDSVAMTQIISLLRLNDMNPALVPDIVEALADRNLYNPAAEWIKSVPWDGTDRLPAFCRTLVQKADFPETLKDLLIRKWLRSAAAAALLPAGFRSRGVLTLQGPQGIGKTAWTKALVSDAALASEIIKLDHHLDAGQKDSLISAITHWLVEIGELDSSLRKDIARLKGFLTSSADKVRRPYGRTEAEYQRRTVFCATVNDDNFLVDSTGNTRWWTIPVVAVDFAHQIDMQQVWAQVAIEVEERLPWWLTAQEEQWLELQNQEHRSVSALRERLLDRLEPERRDDNNLRAKTAIEVLRAIGIDNPNNLQCKECGSILREVLGPPKRINGRDRWRVPLAGSDSLFDGF